MAATPRVDGVCAFQPPFADQPPIAVASPRALPSGVGVPAPQQTPPTIPLPALKSTYTLTVDQVDFPEGRLHTMQTVRVTNAEECALDRLYFSVTAARWGWFTLDAVQVGGQAINTAVNGTVLPVPLPSPLRAGATTEIQIEFRLDVGQAVDPYTPGGFPGTTQTGDILRLAYWFPILSDDHQYPPYLDPPYTASADYVVTFTVPKEIVIAATGNVTQEQPNADGTITRRYEAQNVRDFVLALSPSFRLAQGKASNGVFVEVYYSPYSFSPRSQTPGRIEQLVESALADAMAAQERLSKLIGPYPYPTLRVVDGGANLLGGIEFPGLIMVNLNYDSTDLIYHEVGHEWFYGLIGTRAQQEPWIDEGGATFLAAYLQGTLLTIPPPANRYPYRLSTPVWGFAAGGSQSGATASIYDQGGDFYTRVLQQMGEERFWAALQTLYRDHLYGIITSRDILTTWQAASPTDLRPLFKEYLDYPWIDQISR